MMVRAQLKLQKIRRSNSLRGSGDNTIKLCNSENIHKTKNNDKSGHKIDYKMIIERLWGTKIDFSRPPMHVEKAICAI